MFFPTFASSQKERQLNINTYGIVFFFLNPDSEDLNYQFLETQGTNKHVK